MVLAGQTLAGKRILITRSRSQAGSLIDRIASLGGDPIVFPVITISDPDSWEPVDEAIMAIDRYRWLVITSPNGAERFLRRLETLALGVSVLAHLQVVAVGTTTAHKLADLGRPPDLIPTEFRGEALPGLMGPRLLPGDAILMMRGDLADTSLPEQLRLLGAQVDDRVVYRTLPEEGDASHLRAMLAADQIDYVTLTSPSTAHGLVERLGGPDLLDSARVVCIGPSTRKAAEAAGLRVHLTADPYTADGMIDAMLRDSNRDC